MLILTWWVIQSISASNRCIKFCLIPSIPHFVVEDKPSVLWFWLGFQGFMWLILTTHIHIIFRGNKHTFCLVQGASYSYVLTHAVKPSALKYSCARVESSCCLCIVKNYFHLDKLFHTCSENNDLHADRTNHSQASCLEYTNAWVMTGRVYMYILGQYRDSY